METSNYELFSLLKGNRAINNAHVNRLIKSFKTKDIINPITVNEKMEIINGQHRFMARKALGLSIHYNVLQGGGLDDVHILNSNTKGWTTNDFLQSHLTNGLIEYKKYEEFKREFKYKHTDILFFLTGSYTNAHGKMFQQGTFVASNHSQGVMLARKIRRTGRHYANYHKRGFVSAMVRLFKIKHFKLELLLKRMEKHRMLLEDQPSVDRFESMLKTIYNIGTQKKDKLPTYL